MSNFDKNRVLQLAQALDGSSEKDATQAFQAIQMYLQRHGRSFADLIADQGVATKEVVDYRTVEKLRDLEKENKDLRAQVEGLEKKSYQDAKSYKTRIESLEGRIKKKEGDYTELNNNFNYLNSWFTQNKSELEDHRRKVASLSHVKIKRSGWFITGMLTTLFVGAVATRVGGPDIYDEVRTLTVNPIAYVFGDNAKAISRWIPRGLWYDKYATVSTEFANVRLMETTASPVLTKLSTGSCVMVRDTSNIDPTWFKIEQRIDGKLVQGYMQSNALTVEEGYIGKPCKGIGFGG